jgi:hypothetical protein
LATPGVGQDIEDICVRCGDTWHVVMAKMGDRVVKVVCKLCGTHHNYRGDKNGEAATAGGASSSGTWGAGRRRKVNKKAPVPAPAPPAFDPAKPPRAYSARETYLPGERIIHAAFGVGVVATIPGPGKVEVIFPAGPRTLACAKAASTLERPTAADHMPVSDRPPTPREDES